jgi:N-acetylmuramoyl-L-alanine amidase
MDASRLLAGSAGRTAAVAAMLVALVVCQTAGGATAGLSQNSGQASGASTSAPAKPRGQASAMRDVTFTRLPRGERVTIEFSHEVGSTGERVGSPDRVYFDFTNSSAASGVIERAQSIKGALVTSVRIGRHPNGTTRVVLELAGKPRYSAFAMYSPFRFVVDVETAPPLPTEKPGPPPPPVIEPAFPRAVPPAESASGTAGDKPKPSAASPATPPPATAPALPAASQPSGGLPGVRPEAPAITRRGDYSLARQLGLGVSRIVIDPGHGGHDPGAQANGLKESELVLDVALRLEQLLLQQPGIEVVLTRRTNEFVALEERTETANRESADLFLSIHANASRQATSRGIETYFLNFATNPGAEAVAARENATSERKMKELPDIVKAIALNNKLEESREFASIVQTSLVRRLRAQSQATKDLGVKQAPFVVLIGAGMPSVLSEISFVTNRSEAGLLKLSSYRQRIAEALCDAILKYQNSLKKITTVAGAGNRR